MGGGEELAQAVATAVEESVVPMIQVECLFELFDNYFQNHQGHTLTDTKCATIIKGLSLMRPTISLASKINFST